MKLAIVLLGVLAGSSAQANDYRPALAGDKSIVQPAQQQQVLRSIKKFCSDNWCAEEDDLDYKFKSFKCSGLECVLRFEMLLLGEDDDGSGTHPETEVFPGKCVYKPVRSLSDLVDPTYMLNPRFARFLDKCFGRHKEKLPPRELPEDDDALGI